MNKPNDLLLPVRNVVSRHDDEREEALNDELESLAHARDYPGPYIAPLRRFTAACGCEARLEEECDGESVWEAWVWDSGMCTFDEREAA